MGRPSNKERQKTEEGLSLLEQVVILYEEGGSDAEVCKVLKVLPKDFEKKYKTDSDFAKLVDYGRLASKAWWLSVGRKAVSNKGKFDYNFWSSNMEHRFDWKKTSTVNVNEEKDTRTPKQLLDEFVSKKAGLQKIISKAMTLEEADGSIESSTGS